tara:strand:+ start:198 stop:971 length:774 start_codon:yes stop_codon:yes gene_type:complete
MNPDQTKKIALELIDTFKKAGIVAIELRKKGLIKKIKPDNTPVTNADIEINNILLNKISGLTPSIPIISEETTLNKKKENLKNFWLIDPIDGTHPYINNKDEFTVNAALIINKKPALGLINAPGKNRLFYSYGPSDSYEITGDKKRKLIKLNKKNKNIITAVSYSNNLNSKILEFHNKFKVNTYKKIKSSLKFCLIATGEFDLYIADPRAHEWDIAAGHAILEHAGGSVTDFNGNEIEYGKKNFINTSLILKSKNIL